MLNFVVFAKEKENRMTSTQKRDINNFEGRVKEEQKHFSNILNVCISSSN